MEKTAELAGFLIVIFFSLAIAVGMIWLNSVLGPKHKSNSIKDQPFECGLKPFSSPEGHLSANFYLPAVFFVLFDVLVMLLIFWSLAIRPLGCEALMALVPLIIIIGVCYLFAWKERLLEV